MTLLTSPAVALLLRTTLLLGLALLAVRLLRGRGPTVQTLVGRASLAAVALLLLTAPLTQFVPPLWQVPAPRPAAPGVALAPTALPPQRQLRGEGEAGNLPRPLLQRGEREGSPAPTAAPGLSWKKPPAKQGSSSLIPPLKEGRGEVSSGSGPPEPPCSCSGSASASGI